MSKFPNNDVQEQGEIIMLLNTYKTDKYGCHSIAPVAIFVKE